MHLPFSPLYPVGRHLELKAIQDILVSDGDVMLAGVTGSGRRSLIRYAAEEVGARVLELDCLRANTSVRFLELLTEGLRGLCISTPEKQWMQSWYANNGLSDIPQSLRGEESGQQQWIAFQRLLKLPQQFAEYLGCRIVFVFQNFPHVRSWDRAGKWEADLRDIIQRHSRVSYVMLATVVENWAIESNLPTLSLVPLAKADLQVWVEAEMEGQRLRFEPEALDLFLDYVQGHIGDARILARRIWLDCRALGSGDFERTSSAVSSSPTIAENFSTIGLARVQQSTWALMEDFSSTFESLLLLLPPIQSRVLESLAIDPTEQPHAREYIQKHQLSRGGGLQGALASLEQKGLIYGSHYGYQIAMPLLRLWLKHRLAG
jgi:hypothetical protein